MTVSLGTGDCASRPLACAAHMLLTATNTAHPTKRTRISPQKTDYDFALTGTSVQQQDNGNPLL